MSSDFNTSKSAIHCFEYCFSSEARLGYTLFFLLLPIVFYLTEFLTLTERLVKVCVIFPYFLLKSNLNINRYEVTTLRRKLKNSCKEMKHYCCQPLKLFSSLFQFLSWMLVTCITVIFWQPITALFKVIYPLCTSIYHIDTNFLSF